MPAHSQNGSAALLSEAKSLLARAHACFKEAFFTRTHFQSSIAVPLLSYFLLVNATGSVAVAESNTADDALDASKIKTSESEKGGEGALRHDTNPHGTQLNSS